MKRFFCCLLALSLLVMLAVSCKRPDPEPTPNPAADFEYEVNEEGEITLTGATRHFEEEPLIIPQQIEDKDVTAIAPHAFEYANITALQIPDTVTFLGDYAFASSKVSEITLSKTLTQIGFYTFACCQNLQEIKIPASLSRISAAAFDGSGLKRVTLEDGITEIGPMAFQSTAIESIDIPGSITTVSEYAFSGCASLASVTLHDGLQTLADYAFASSRLVGLVIPKTVTNVSEIAFDRIPTLEKVTFEGNAPEDFLKADMISGNDFTVAYHSNATGFSFPRWNGYKTEILDTQVTAQVYNGFEYFENENATVTISAYLGSEEAVSIPAEVNGKTVTEIGTSAFKSNETLKSVFLPETVTTIHARAFYYCRQLDTVSLPSGLLALGDHAFDLCEALKEITLPSTITQWGTSVLYDYGVETVKFANGLTTLPTGALTASAKTVILPATLRDVTADQLLASSPYLESVKFEGDAPLNFGQNPTSGNAITVYYHEGAMGFTSPTWCGFSTEIW